MAAVFPLDTSKPWVFNGVTYEYDATEDRWFVISTTATDQVVSDLSSLEQSIDVTNTIIDQEIENRSQLLDAATTKNNQQDASISELDARIDAIGAVVGVLEFKGKYKYVLEKTVEACTAAYAQCLLQAGGDVPAMSECNRLKDECEAAVDDPYVNGVFTSKGTTNVMEEIEEFVLTNVDLDGQSLDWINLVEPEDYIEFVEKTGGDTALYECIEEPKIYSTERSIRVKFIKDIGGGDSKFNLQKEYDVRVIKASTGIDIIEADKRYLQKPYVVYFEDNPANITPVKDEGLKNGELWFDTSSLELFVWNNNAWVGASPPPSQDLTVTSLQAEITALKAKPDITSSTTAPDNAKQGDLWFNPSTLKFAFYTGGAWVNPDQS